MTDNSASTSGPASLRPPQPPTPAPDAFTIHRAPVADDISLAYVREGVGGYPLLLLHGFPETKRIWWRNIEPLVAAGFEVIVPDLRGSGDSDLSAADEYDLAVYSIDVHTLVTETLGHSEVGVIAGDIGGVVAVDLCHRFAGFVSKMIFFNTVAPTAGDQPEWYADRGLDMNPLPDTPSGDYRIRQGRDHAQLRGELDTPERCRRYVHEFYEHRLWASPFSFTEADIEFMTEPFADIERLAASWAPYQLQYGRSFKEIPLIAPTDTPTMVLYGPDDHAVPDDFAKRCEIAFPNRVGPLVVPECGHFLQWERADALNDLAVLFFADLRS